MSKEPGHLQFLRQLGRETKGTPIHFRFEIPEALNAGIDETIRLVLTTIQENKAIGQGQVLRRPVYQRLFGPPLKESKTSKLEMADEAIPQKPNEAVVNEEIRRIATAVCTLLTLDSPSENEAEEESLKRGVEIALHTHLRRNLEFIADSRIFYLGKDRWISTKEIQKALRDTIAAIAEKSLRPDIANVYLLHRLGGITHQEILRRSQKKPGSGIRKGKRKSINFSDYDHEELRREIEESMTDSREFLNELVSWLQDIIREQKRDGILNGDVPRPMPDINTKLRNKGMFEMLKILFDKETDHRDANDAQMLLIFFLIHWNYQRYLEPIKVRTQSQLDRAVTGIFNTGKCDGYEPVLSFREEHFKVVDERGFTQELHTTQINGKTYPMYLEEMDVKKSFSFMSKMLHKREGLRRTEDIGDLFRTRLVAWDLTRKDFEENTEAQRDMKTICTQVAGHLNLIELEGTGVSMQDLPKGKYWVEAPDPGNPFTKFTLKARLHNGAPFELQIVPLDLHCFESTKGTGIDHDKYKEGVYGDLLQMLVPRSTSSLTHEAIENNRTARNRLRATTTRAMNTPEILQFFREFKSRSLAPSPSSPEAEPAAAQD